MATLKQLVDSSVGRLDSVPDSFIDLVDSQNAVLWKELQKLLLALEVQDGLLVANEKNLAQLQIIANKLEQVLFGGEYLEGVKSYLGEFDKQSLLVNAIYAEQFDAFSDKALYKNIVGQAQRSTLALYDTAAVNKNWTLPLTKIMQDNVLTRGSYTDLVAVLNEYVNGSAARQAALSKYVSTTARDAFNIFNRNYSLLVGNDIEVEFYEYAGGTVRDSREFCMQRAGRIFSKKEIESWSSGSWQGQIPGTDRATIFSYAGGYNCRHAFIPVTNDRAESNPFTDEVR